MNCDASEVRARQHLPRVCILRHGGDGTLKREYRFPGPTEIEEGRAEKQRRGRERRVEAGGFLERTERLVRMARHIAGHPQIHQQTGVVRTRRRQLSVDRGGSVEAARLHRRRPFGRACGDRIGRLRRADVRGESGPAQEQQRKRSATTRGPATVSKLEPDSQSYLTFAASKVAAPVRRPHASSVAPERGAVQVSVWIAPLWMVEQVEGLDAEFDALVGRTDWECAEERRVHVPVSGPAELIPPGVARASRPSAD